MNTLIDLKTLLIGLQENGVEYILIGGQSLALHGYPRATEDIDIVVPFDQENGRKLINALHFLDSSRDLQSEWFSFEANSEEIQNIRIQDDLIVDILFAANGQTYETLIPHIRIVEINGISIRTLDIDGLLKTKTSFREQDIADRSVLLKLKSMSEKQS
jgi:acylphosphatase